MATEKSMEQSTSKGYMLIKDFARSNLKDFPEEGREKFIKNMSIILDKTKSLEVLESSLNLFDSFAKKENWLDLSFTSDILKDSLAFYDLRDFQSFSKVIDKMSGIFSDLKRTAPEALRIIDLAAKLTAHGKTKEEQERFANAVIALIDKELAATDGRAKDLGYTEGILWDVTYDLGSNYVSPLPSMVILKLFESSLNEKDIKKIKDLDKELFGSTLKIFYNFQGRKAAPPEKEVESIIDAYSKDPVKLGFAVDVAKNLSFFDFQPSELKDILTSPRFQSSINRAADILVSSDLNDSAFWNRVFYVTSFLSKLYVAYGNSIEKFDEGVSLFEKYSFNKEAFSAIISVASSNMLHTPLGNRPTGEEVELFKTKTENLFSILFDSEAVNLIKASPTPGEYIEKLGNLAIEWPEYTTVSLMDAARYYIKLLKRADETNSAVPSLSHDEKLLEAALKNIQNGSIDPIRYTAALYGRVIIKDTDYLEAYYYDEVFKDKGKAIHYLGKFMKSMGIKRSNLLSEKELQTILLYITYFGDDFPFYNHFENETQKEDFEIFVKGINKFTERRLLGYTVKVDGFNQELLNSTKIVGVVPIDSFKVNAGEAKYNVVINTLQDQSRLKDYIVFGILGSRNPEKKQTVNESREFLKNFLDDKSFGYLTSKTVFIAKNNPNIFAEIKNAQTFEEVKKIFLDLALQDQKLYVIMGDLFSKMDLAQKEGDIANKAIVAFTVKGKENVITVNSASVGACVFFPRISGFDSINYALQDPVVLVYFSVSKMPIKAKIEDLEVHGVAICGIGYDATTSKKVFYIDSIEGGILFNEAAEPQENKKKIIEILINYARDLGAEEVVISPKPVNRTPLNFSKFAAEVFGKNGGEPDLRSISIPLTAEVYFEWPYMAATGIYNNSSRPDCFRKIEVVELKMENAKEDESEKKEGEAATDQNTATGPQAGPQEGSQQNQAKSKSKDFNIRE